MSDNIPEQKNEGLYPEHRLTGNEYFYDPHKGMVFKKTPDGNIVDLTDKDERNRIELGKITVEELASHKTRKPVINELKPDKFYFDLGYSISDYCEVAGITPDQLIEQHRKAYKDL